MGIICVVLLAVGLIGMCFIKALPGFLIYLAGVALAAAKLKNEPGFDIRNWKLYTFAAMKKENFSKGNFFSKGVYLLTMAVLPVMAALWVFCWIYVDSVREADKLEQEYYEEMDRIENEYNDEMNKLEDEYNDSMDSIFDDYYLYF